MSTGLKPCPFCGNKKIRSYTLDYLGDKWVIRCDNMECFVKPFADFDTDFDKSARMWNMRTL